MESLTSVKELQNKKVYDANGNDCGHISTLLFSADSQLLFAVIKLEDDITTDNGSTAIPWSSLIVNSGTGDLSVNLNRNFLMSAPKIQKSDFKLSNRNVYYDLLKYYGNIPVRENPQFPVREEMHGNFHERTEGEEFTGSPLDDIRRNKMGEELDFDKLKGLDRRAN